jgi:hypothetical protein
MKDMATRWGGLIGRLLLVLGLVAAPWPAVMGSNWAIHEAAARPATSDDAPCPMQEHATIKPTCPCCDDGAACSAAQCVMSTPAPGLPAAATSVETISDGTIRGADGFTRPPEPRPREPLRPPIV